MEHIKYSILLTIAVHYNNVNMYPFDCLIIIVIWNMILNRPMCIFYSWNYLFLLFVLIRNFTNLDSCSPQIIRINEVLLYVRLR
jgi:hypothetical protein